MICGICKNEGVTIAHVRECSGVSEEAVAIDNFMESEFRQPTPEDDRLAMEQVGLAGPTVLESGMIVSLCEGAGHDPEYYSIVESRQGHLYAKKWNPDVRKWEYDKGAISVLRKQERAVWQKVDLEEAKEFGRAFGCCMVCGATLTNPDSIEAGIGPVCAGRF